LFPCESSLRPDVLIIDQPYKMYSSLNSTDDYKWACQTLINVLGTIG